MIDINTVNRTHPTVILSECETSPRGLVLIKDPSVAYAPSRMTEVEMNVYFAPSVGYRKKLLCNFYFATFDLP